MVSLDVEIFRPSFEFAFAAKAADAARVRPLHVTVTAPAARVALPPRVSVISFADVNLAPAAVKGEEMPQAALFDIVPDNRAGNVKMIASVPPAVRAVEVVKVMVAVPPAPTAELSCNAVAAFAITAPTAGVLT